ncbi:unnamed protein product [Heligmosomoides polygyrus]|uniref:RING-type E3 ubiquitin transferase n=1 Tax=Heligmosomoides polygyrus TaxID=6339 RepID=A0A183FIS9_HELPZ|nr:unnamed protein product [Heligmosomoides polygyrus]
MGEQLAPHAVPSSAREQETPAPTKPTTEEVAWSNTIKSLVVREQLMPACVALSYLLTRLVAKSTQHVINHAKQFSAIPSKYGLNLDPNLNFVFDERTVESIRNSMVSFQPTVAVYLQSLFEKLEVAVKPHIGTELWHIRAKPCGGTLYTKRTGKGNVTNTVIVLVCECVIIINK